MDTFLRTCLRVLWCTLWLLGAIFIFTMWWQASGSTVTTATGAPLLIELGRICGLFGTYLILWQLVFMSRLPALERAVSFNRITHIHRWNGGIGIALVTAHIILLLLGYAALNNVSLIAQYLDFQFNWADVLAASFGYGFMLAMVVLTVTIVRRRLRYETWYAVHITAYMAIALFFSHQFSVGGSLVDNSDARLFWYTLYALAFGGIIVYRMGVPLYRYKRHGFTVKRVVTEAPGVVSIYIGGRSIKQFRYVAGQYAIWRFLTPDLWLQAHPFSFSIAPGGKELRLTAKAVGDFTRLLQDLKPGAPVIIDGPHGNFGMSVAEKRPPLFVAGGIGITPLRAMIEALPKQSSAPILIYAARTKVDLALRSELESLLAERGGTVQYVLSEDSGAGFHQGIVDASLLTKIVPEVALREVFLCGPPSMMKAVRKTLKSLGVPPGRIHTERFAFVETKTQSPQKLSD